MMNREWDRAYCIGQIQAIVRKSSHATAGEMVEEVRKALADLNNKRETQK